MDGTEGTDGTHGTDGGHGDPDLRANALEPQMATERINVIILGSLHLVLDMIMQITK